jgi:hypothetical protein
MIWGMQIMPAIKTITSLEPSPRRVFTMSHHSKIDAAD